MLSAPPATRARSPERARPRGGLQQRKKMLAVTLFAPTLVLIGIFVYGFIGFTVRVSVTKNYNPINRDLTPTQHWWTNYATLLQNVRFQDGLRNVIIFTVLVIAVSVLVGLTLALLVHNTLRAAGFFRSIYLLPYAISGIVTGVVWRWIFTPQTGVNTLLQSSGISSLYEQLTGSPLQPDWITDPRIVGNLDGVLAAVFPGAANVVEAQLGIPLALIPVIIAAGWQLSGFAMALFLAGLGGIPEELIEAAKMDGAGAWQTFRRVTLPLLRPTIVIAMVLLAQLALKSFDLVYSMVGTGPGFTTDMPSIFVYDQMFRALSYNLGSAASIVMFVLVGLVVVPYLIRIYGRGDRDDRSG